MNVEFILPEQRTATEIAHPRIAAEQFLDLAVNVSAALIDLVIDVVPTSEQRRVEGGTR